MIRCIRCLNSVRLSVAVSQIGLNEFSLIQCSRILFGGLLLLMSACGSTPSEVPTSTDIRPADLLIVDCLLPPQVKQLGSQISYLSPRLPIRTSAARCALRGGEYVAHDRADFRTALRVWLPQAHKGDPQAQTYVGEIYEKGLGTPASYATAASWYQLAANQNNSRAQINLGYLYESGLGVDRDLTRALNLYREASGFTAAELEFVSPSNLAQREATKDKAEQLQSEVSSMQSQINAYSAALAQQSQALTSSTEKIKTLGKALATRQRESLKQTSTASDNTERDLQDIQSLQVQLDAAIDKEHRLSKQLQTQNDERQINIQCSAHSHRAN